MNQTKTSKARGRWETPFRSLRHRNYRLWFFGQGLSLVGTWMQTMAQQVLIYRLTGSATALGIANFVSVIPLIPLSLWGGSLSDRMSKRSVILATQTLMLLQALILAALTWAGIVRVEHVFLMSFILGAAKAVDGPARQSFIVDMVEGKEDLTNAIGLNSAIFNGARTLGPAFAGIAVATMGEAVAFFLNALSFIAVIASLFMMRNLPNTSARPQVNTNMTRYTFQGIRYVLDQQTLLVLMSLVAVSSFLATPYSTLMPIFANEMLKPSAQPIVAFICGGQYLPIHCQAPEALPLGLLLTAVGIGAVTGALVVASLSENAQRGRMLTLGNLGFSLALLIFANSSSMSLSLVVMVFVGICFVLQNAMANTLLQIHAPDELRGRVMSLYSLVLQGMTNVGGLQAGLVADWISAPLSVGVGAAVSLAYGVFVAIRFKRVRELV